MKQILFIALVCLGLSVHGQSLPINFEGDIVTADFVNFDGGTATVIANPQMTGINTSPTVAQIVRDGGAIWGGSKIALAENLDFTSSSSISMKVFSTAPIGTIVKFKLEGGGTPVERDQATTVTNSWELMTWDFSGVPKELNEVVFMFDFGNVGNGSETSTFLFDDVTQIYVGEQIDLPVDFENSSTNYTLTDFGGNIATFVTDPTDASNNVIQVVKPLGAATWAGTTIGTPAGFATDIPLLLTDSKMYVKVWSPDAGTPIRLKVEDSKDPTHTCETETNTTLTADCEVLEFDFVNQAPGTESLSVGLSMGWTYNKASIFFNFNTDGDTAGEKTYFFDNVSFGPFVVGFEENQEIQASIYPNPTSNFWTIESQNNLPFYLEIYKQTGERVISKVADSGQLEINAESYPSGLYFAVLSTDNGKKLIKLVKE